MHLDECFWSQHNSSLDLLGSSVPSRWLDRSTCDASLFRRWCCSAPQGGSASSPGVLYWYLLSGYVGPFLGGCWCGVDPAEQFLFPRLPFFLQDGDHHGLAAQVSTASLILSLTRNSKSPNPCQPCLLWEKSKICFRTLSPHGTFLPGWNSWWKESRWMRTWWNSDQMLRLFRRGTWMK